MELHIDTALNFFQVNIKNKFMKIIEKLGILWFYTLNYD